jgi:hypothetical protein
MTSSMGFSAGDAAALISNKKLELGFEAQLAMLKVNWDQPLPNDLSPGQKGEWTQQEF